MDKTDRRSAVSRKNLVGDKQGSRAQIHLYVEAGILDKVTLSVRQSVEVAVPGLTGPGTLWSAQKKSSYATVRAAHRPRYQGERLRRQMPKGQGTTTGMEDRE